AWPLFALASSKPWLIEFFSIGRIERQKTDAASRGGRSNLRLASLYRLHVNPCCDLAGLYQARSTDVSLLWIHDLHAFRRGPLHVEPRQAFGHRADFAIANLAIVDPDHAG